MDAVAVAVQLLAVPIMVYVAVPAVLLLLLDNAWAIGVPLPALPPLIPLPCTTLHVYVVPPVVLVNATLGALPLHTEVTAGVAVITGIGFTVIIAVAVPVQLLAVPVIV